MIMIMIMIIIIIIMYYYHFFPFIYYFLLLQCLVQLYSCDGWEVTTIEGLGNVRSGLHEIQQRMVQYNASQCGFCTPAQVMNMYG